MSTDFNNRKKALQNRHIEILERKNNPENLSNGIYKRYQYPIITAEHIPLKWRYDFDPKTNPFLMERFGINSTFNAGAIFFGGKYVLIVRVEGNDRKSFFAVARSDTPTEGFVFDEYPILMPENDNPDTNIYDIRLVSHEDGWIYGIFCSERKDKSTDNYDTSTAIAQAGIARTKDLVNWERLSDLKTTSEQQRNVVLHPEFIHGKYAFYTRPQDGFIKAGKGGGIGWGLCDDIERACIDEEIIVDNRVYHTIKEVKNGQGPAPIKTKKGWLHVAHGVRNTANGLRYVLYLFVTSLEKPWVLIASPGGYLLAPRYQERVGDVSNVVFTNGWISDRHGKVYLYYASSDTRVHVAETSIEQLLDYAFNTPEDGLSSQRSVQTINKIIINNKKLHRNEYY